MYYIIFVCVCVCVCGVWCGHWLSHHHCGILCEKNKQTNQTANEWESRGKVFGDRAVLTNRVDVRVLRSKQEQRTYDLVWVLVWNENKWKQTNKPNEDSLLFVVAFAFTHVCCLCCVRGMQCSACCALFCMLVPSHIPCRFLTVCFVISLSYCLCLYVCVSVLLS